MYQLKILKSILVTQDISVLNIIDQKCDYVFYTREPVNANLELFEIILNYYNRYDKVPSMEYLKEFFKHEKSNPAKEAFNSLIEEKEFSEDLSGLVEAQLYYIVKKLSSEHLRSYRTKVNAANTSQTLYVMQEASDQMSSLVHVLDIEEHKKALIYGEKAQTSFEKRYRKQKMQKDYFICNYMIRAIDDYVGGITQADFINVLGYVKQFKSTFMRFLGYRMLLQGKNVVVVSLEMPFEAIENAFHTLHANNYERFGYDKPKITVNGIKEGSLNSEQEEYLLEEVVPDFTSAPDLGSLYILQPSSDYTVDEMFADLRQIHKNVMPVDAVLLDYATLLKPSERGYIDKDSINQMIRRIRLFNLSFENNRGMTIFNAAQCLPTDTKVKIRVKNAL